MKNKTIINQLCRDNFHSRHERPQGLWGDRPGESMAFLLHDLLCDTLACGWGLSCVRSASASFRGGTGAGIHGDEHASCRQLVGIPI